MFAYTIRYAVETQIGGKFSNKKMPVAIKKMPVIQFLYMEIVW